MTIEEKDRRYKIMTETTMGWTLIADDAQNLTKGQCDKMLNDALRAGANPQYIKVVANNDPKYINAETGRSV
tara:strand:- start:173 stop:388 length:216 start_codon:yes stop_codon:yes gene_type:complete